jgi:hypothetical protein
MLPPGVGNRIGRRGVRDEREALEEYVGRAAVGGALGVAAAATSH